MFRGVVLSGLCRRGLQSSYHSCRIFESASAVIVPCGISNIRRVHISPMLSSKRFFCDHPATVELAEDEPTDKVVKKEIPPERLELLQGLFLKSGAKDFETSITCEHLQQTLVNIVEGQHDPVTKQIIEKIVSTADIDHNGVISWQEFIQWFEPLKDDNLSLKSLFDYWSMNSELKSPKVIFNNVWAALKTKYGEERLIFPSEILCLGGAPGSGKGTNTPFILRERGITAKPIVMSSILRSPAMQKIKAEGGLVGDYEVLKTLLEELLLPTYARGAVVDGFPRTAIQVEFLRMLADEMTHLQHKYSKTDLAYKFQRPAFRMIVLYVNETESVRRQLARGRQALQHNEKVKQTGQGKLLEVRETDISVSAARKRYKVFSEQALEALQSLKKEFPYHVIDASGDIQQVELEIIRELAYQSSLELAYDTYEAIRDIPTSKNISSNARQQLVMRLDTYQNTNTEVFHAVIGVIKERFIPVFKRHALSGAARVVINSDESAHVLLEQHPEAVGMIIDILADRDFSVYAVEQKDYGSMFDVRFRTRGLQHKHEGFN